MSAPRRLAALRPPPCLELAVVLFFLLSLAWAVTSPLGSVPDEPAHVIYAGAVVRGELGSGPLGHDVKVPATLAQAGNTTCPAFRPYVTADCIQPIGGGSEMVATQTSAGRYPPLYYALVGWPTLFGFGDTAWLLMRLLSTALASLLLWIGACAWRRSSGVLAAGVIVAVSPMVTFMAGSVNPNGVEIAAGIAFTLAASGLVEQWRGQDSTRWAAPAATAVTGSYLALARPGSHLLLVALVGVITLLGLREILAALRRGDRALLLTTAVLGAAVVSALVYARLAAPAGTAPVANPVGLRAALATTLYTADDYLYETAGIFGWRDHVPPLQLRLVWIGMSAALVSAAWFCTGWRERTSLLLLAVGSIVLAPLFVYLTLFRDGVGYQARYAMALTQALPLLAAVLLARRGWAPGTAARRAFASVPLVALGVQLPVLAGSWLRYAVGLPLELDPLHIPGQVRWVPTAWPLDVVLCLASVAVVLVLHRMIRDGGGALDPGTAEVP